MSRLRTNNDPDQYVGLFTQVFLHGGHITFESRDALARYPAGGQRIISLEGFSDGYVFGLLELTDLYAQVALGSTGLFQ